MKNLNVLITGGTTGIGLATAKLLLEEGARVAVTGRNSATLEQAKQALPGAIVLRSDSASLEDARRLGEQVADHLPTIDALFLNAGVGKFGPVEAMTPELFGEMFDINVRGPYFQLQSLLPRLANPSSVLINASIVARLGFPGTSVYSATKAAVVALAKSLAVELAPRGIRVNTVSPGPVQTPIYGKLGMPTDAQNDFESRMAESTLVKRFGTPDEVAHLARFLLSPQSSFIVGEDIAIDGGIQHT